MARVQVKNEIEIYEIDGSETFGAESSKMEILSHWNNHEMVVLRFAKKELTVVAADLETAINNATNTK